MKKLAIITIHKGNIANLKNIKIGNSSKILPNTYIIIAPKLPKLLRVNIEKIIFNL